MSSKEHSTEFVQHLNKIVFYLNGQYTSAAVPAGISTLDFLNRGKHLYGTKCSCNEGDCGACTVVIASPREGNIVYEAVTSCLYPAAKLHGKHLITIEGLGTPDSLHPIQQALLDFHGTQCGYCTPGFVMSLFALFAMQDSPTRETIYSALEGNLCRCTGYQSILDAAEYLSAHYRMRDIVPAWCRTVEPELFSLKEPQVLSVQNRAVKSLVQTYHLPENTHELFDLRKVYPEAILIAGGTDLMVQMNISRREIPILIDLSRLPELSRLYLQPDGLHIGAGVSYGVLQASGIVKRDYPALHALILQIASQQIRNFGTLGGNIANASPIGDSLPLLLAMNATLFLQSPLEVRQLSIREFFTGYRQTALKKDEIIREIVLPVVPDNAYLNSIKSAKRKSVDISSVVSAVYLETKLGYVQNAALALGGVAPTPVLSTQFALLLNNKPLGSIDSLEVIKAVQAEFKPISDVRGSALYRSKLIANHLKVIFSELEKGE